MAWMVPERVIHATSFGLKWTLNLAWWQLLVAAGLIVCGIVATHRWVRRVQIRRSAARHNQPIPKTVRQRVRESLAKRAKEIKKLVNKGKLRDGTPRPGAGAFPNGSVYPAASTPMFTGSEFPPERFLRGAAVDEVMQEGFLDSYRNGMAAAAAAGSGVGVGPGAHAGAPDVITMVLQTCRDLGHFDEAAFVEIYKHVETVHVRAGEALFSVGDRDDSIFVVLRGEINLMVTGESGVQSRIAIKRTGDSITSLLSLLEMLGGNDSYFKTVSAVATVNSDVVKIPPSALRAVQKKNPESLIRIVQTIVMRLQRVTFLTLYRYFGLTSELMAEPLMTPSGSETSLNEAGGEAGEHVVKTDAEALDDLQDLLGVGSDGRGSPVFRDSVGHETDDSSEDGTLSDLGVREVAAGTMITRQGQAGASMFYVVSGTLSVHFSDFDTNQEYKLYDVGAGQLTGHFAAVTGLPSFVSTLAVTNCRLIAISPEVFKALVSASPDVLIHTSLALIARLSPFVRQIDFCLDWIHAGAGESIYEQGGAPDGTFIILGGRVRVTRQRPDTRIEFVNEFGRGETLGEIEVLTQIPRATSVHAIRDTELVRIPACTFEWVKRVQPFVLEHFSRVLGSKLLEAYSRNGTLVNAEEPSSHSNLASIVLIPATPDVPLTAFASALTVALSRVGRARHLNADKVGAELGVADFRRSDTYRLVQWLSHQEEKHRLVVYEADATLTGWTDRCIRQADLILIVGLGAGEPAVSPIESVLGHYRSKAFVELVLLHEATVRSPRRTVEWLNNRDWVSGHHHIRCSDFLLYGHAGRPAPPTGDSDSDGEAGGAAASPGTSPGQPRKGTRLHPDDEETDDEVRAAAARRWADPTNHMSDYGRLARRIMGTSIGLALGGGGARGCAHIGIIRALHEAGIPIDVVSGTSMGSFVGALYAEEMDWAAVRDRTAHYCRDMDKLWPKVVDLTYPTTSMLSGAWFNDVIRSVFHRKQIEDLWIPYFAVSTDISANATRAHKHGRLWRYVRASMTLSGYLPPMCDPVDGHYLLDGGYTDNLPGAIINRFGAEHIFCVHVAAMDDAELFNYGDRLSGWWLLWNKWNPLAKKANVPNLSDIQSRLAFVASYSTVTEIQNNDAYDYLRPPIDEYGLLEWSRLDEIADVGYEYGCAVVDQWREDGKLASILGDDGVDDDNISLPGRPLKRSRSTHDSLATTSASPVDAIRVQSLKKTLSSTELRQRKRGLHSS